jgi:hypothetical protein
MENKATIDRMEMQHSDKELASSSIMAVGTLNGLHYVRTAFVLVQLGQAHFDKREEEENQANHNYYCKSCV